MYRDALGDDNQQRNLCVNGLVDGVFGKCRGNESDRDIGAGSCHCLSNGCEYGQFDIAVGHGRASLAGVDTANDLGTCGKHAGGVLRTLTTGDALHDDLGILVQKDRHSFLFSRLSRA